MTKKVKIQSQSLKIPKTIIVTAKFLELISSKLATRFAAKLFTTPIKFPPPKREIHMIEKSIQSDFVVKKINKRIRIYEYGSGEKKVLLVHGWSGRGTQLVKIADALLENGYKVVSFDAPAHGKSSTKSSLMPEFIASIHEIDKKFGPFEFAIGHSLGGMSIVNAVSQGFNINKGIIIGSGDIIQDIIDDFIKKISLKPKIGVMMKEYFEKKFNEPMENYATSNASKKIKIPFLIIHDENDEDVHFSAAKNINNNLLGSKLIITKKLGHRKILGDKFVIENIISFLK
ncbi:MAG: alpha/beta hydrolase [Flavobacteriaceae bacterium]